MVRPSRGTRGNRMDGTTRPIGQGNVGRDLGTRPGKSGGNKRENLASHRNAAPTPPSPVKKRGEYHFQSGQKYFGDLKDGLPHGYGRIKSPDGERFFGEFKKGKPYGYGTHFSAQGFIIFSGLWEGDKAIAGDSPQARLRAMLKSP